MRELKLSALPGIPEVEPGADVAALLSLAMTRAELRFETGDVIVLAQKIISKAERRAVRLDSIQPSPRARELATVSGKDPRLVELILRESHQILRAKPGVLIAEHRLGFVMANAGIDQSNVRDGGDDEVALLLPLDPDESARRLRQRLHETSGCDIGVVINDSFGRAWRNGVTGIAIGVAGIAALVDLRGQHDREHRALKATQVAAADELAAAASLVMGQADEGTPAVLARGFPYDRRESSVRELVRPRAEDLFR